MEERLLALLLASASVTAIAGSRLNWGAHPQGQPLPAVVLNVVSDGEDYTLSGRSGLTEGRVQVDCYALTYEDAKLLSRAVRAVLSGHHDEHFQGVFLAGARDEREGGTNEAERPFRVSMDFLVTFNSTT